MPTATLVLPQVLHTAVQCPPTVTAVALATVPPTPPPPTAPTVWPTATPHEAVAATTAPLAMATALHRPLIAVLTSTPPHTRDTAEHPATGIAAGTTPTALALHTHIVCVPPSTFTPTPPAVWPTATTPGVELPAPTMPHTLAAVATAPTSCGGGAWGWGLQLEQFELITV